MKKSNLYTRTGDTGRTSLVGSSRTDKDAPRLEAYGTIDELNAHIGLVHARTADPDIRATLLGIQHRLFDLGAYLACPPDGTFTLPVGVSDDDILRLEAAIDTIDSRLPCLNSFVLPGGCVESAATHIARTVARRAERRIVSLSRVESVDPLAIRYVNRLSDYLFALARYENISRGLDEIFWHKDC